MELYLFSQNYKATFINKELLCEEMKPWRQWTACFPLRCRDAVSCPSHEKNFLRRSRHRLHTYRNHGLPTPAAPAPATRLTAEVSRSWRCYTCEAPPCTPRWRRAAGLHCIFYFFICWREFICLYTEAGKLMQEGISAVLRQPWTNIIWPTSCLVGAPAVVLA